MQYSSRGRILSLGNSISRTALCSSPALPLPLPSSSPSFPIIKKRSISNKIFIFEPNSLPSFSNSPRARRFSSISTSRPKLSSTPENVPGDELWLQGNVPARYWTENANLRRYMEWLAKKLGYTSPSDWYRITAKSFHENNGGGLLIHFGGSPSNVVTKAFPDHLFLPWLFNSTTRGFFKKLENRKKYIYWLMEKVRVRSESELLYNHFLENHGGWLLMHYGEGSPQRLLDSLKEENTFTKKSESPPRDRKPLNYWASIENQRSFLDEVGLRIGAKNGDLSGWYRVDKATLKKLGCNSLLRQCYDSSHYRMLKKVYPEFDWNPWKFKNPPRNLGEEFGIVEKALKHLESELKLLKPDDWYRLRWTQLNELRVKAVLKGSGGLFQALKTFREDIPWDELKFETSKRRPRGSSK